MNPWEKRKDESDKMYALFQEYLALPYPRSVHKLAQQEGAPRNRIAQSCWRFDWLNRAKAFDSCVQPVDLDADHARLLVAIRKGLFSRFQAFVNEGLLDLNSALTVRLLFEVMDIERKYFLRLQESGIDVDLRSFSMDELLQMEENAKKLVPAKRAN